ncbi:MAG: hypothetical protein II600_01875 [Bacteroidaceae bacterium]|nr:hypothetical protein [Bacteroidaceae bacterium]
MSVSSRYVTFVLLFAAIAFLATACKQRRQPPFPAEGEVQHVDFCEVRNYFVRNDAVLSASPKICSQAQFDQIFGAAAVMGKGGEPTAVDFERQFVVPLVLPETDFATTVEPLEVTREGDVLFCTFAVTRGERQSFTVRPFALMAIDRRYADLQVSVRQKAAGLEMIETQ